MYKWESLSAPKETDYYLCTTNGNTFFFCYFDNDSQLESHYGDFRDHIYHSLKVSILFEYKKRGKDANKWYFGGNAFGRNQDQHNLPTFKFKLQIKNNSKQYILFKQSEGST